MHLNNKPHGCTYLGSCIFKLKSRLWNFENFQKIFFANTHTWAVWQLFICINYANHFTANLKVVHSVEVAFHIHFHNQTCQLSLKLILWNHSDISPSTNLTMMCTILIQVLYIWMIAENYNKANLMVIHPWGVVF